MERYGMVAARVLVAMIFMMNALNIIGQTFAAHEMAANGVPASLIPALIVAARALQFIAGMALMLGIYPRISALALLLFLIIPANRANRAGYEVIRIPMLNGHADGSYEDFLTGFVTKDGQVWGRPVDVAIAKDGCMFVTDDGSCHRLARHLRRRIEPVKN